LATGYYDGAVDVDDAATSRTNLGIGTLGTQDANNVNITGGSITGITNIALGDGGTGASLSDPGADRLLFWDDSAGSMAWLTAGSGLTITGTTITASGGSGSGIVQQVRDQSNAYTSYTGVIPTDNTIPQNTEGDQIFTVTITPSSATNILMFDIYVFCSVTDSDVGITFAIFQDSGADAIFAGSERSEITGSKQRLCSLKHYMVAGTTSSTTFNVRIGTTNASRPIYFNGTSFSRNYGGVAYSTFVVTEIAV
jgi:hypothetical protein